MQQFDLEAFKAFVAGKPADEAYDPGLSHKCALAQFGLCGVTGSNLSTKGVSETVYWAAVPLPEIEEGLPSSWHTFGALTTRLEGTQSGLKQNRGKVGL